MTQPTAIKRSSTPVTAPQVPVDQGSATAQRVDRVLGRNPQAKQAFVFKLPGFRELSMATPNWFKRCQKGMDAINRDTHRFFHKLGVENLFHPDPTVREAATFVAQIAEKNGSDAFDVTPKLRAAVRTLADPSSGAFQRFQHREEKDRFLKETGFGNQLTALARQKLASGAASASPLVELDAVVSAFHPALPHELQERYDAMRQGRVRWSRELDAAVTAYARQTYGGENPFEARSSAGQPVSDLLTFITTGGTEKLAKGGRSIQALNGFDGITFGTRTEALHHLLWNTPFLVRVPPAEANRFMKLYNELANAGL
ncbi:hypothetical protein [Hydrogenophaga borbori]|uniref:hypothetical protein n=1 Tax=Hydrogenophaga borbori TaxID=2294117 RepID=UPI000E34B514|nr:hypothetical protein [Hydrogenophaga borbori]